MSNKPNVGKIIKEQRKKLSLSLYQLSNLSGVSVSHLGRVEQSQRGASIRTLQKIAEPLGFDLFELLVITGHLLPEASLSSDEHREKLRIELNTLLKRMASDTKRIEEIINRLFLSK
ncbi:helix-turn-helix domain-containing protein [Chloroflexota bacterium]